MNRILFALVCCVVIAAVAAPAKWRGFVSDAMCGRHADPECNRRCFKDGQQAVLVLDDSDAVLGLSNPEALKPYPGQHVEVTAIRIGNLLSVTGVKPIGERIAGRGARESDPHIRAVESVDAPVWLSKKDPPLALNVRELMELYHVPGLSVAVIDDFKIAWAKGYGVVAPGSSTPVTPRTLFMAGSIAKTPAAAGALALVRQGKLALDESVNDRLRSWKVPESELTATEKVTLRRILSHTSGLNVHFFPGYESGAPLPSLVQVLRGEKPANTDPIRVEHVPGSEWHYSGGGVLVEQQLMMDVTGEPFPSLMRRVVFEPLGMNDSTYEQPLPSERARNAASGAYASGQMVRGRWHVYPEMAAGGLWTTPSDLARLAIEIALAKKGTSSKLLSQGLAREMLTPQFPRVGEIALGNDQHRDRMGLGFFLGDAARPDLFGHIGDDEGFQAMLYMFGDSGKGAVIMANSENGIRLGDFLLAAIAREYGWQEYVPPGRQAIGGSALVRLVARRNGAVAAINTYRQLRSAGSPQFPVDRETLIAAAYELLAAKRVAEAIEVGKVEAAEYPDYWNAYDTLGELYANAGEPSRSAENYAKAKRLKG